MKRIKVGIVGTGGISDYHFRSYLHNPSVELAAVCDIDGERARRKAEEYGVASAYSDIGALLARDDIDAVSVITWTNTHEDIVVAALRAGKHVLCEKPPALNAVQAARMQRVAEECGKLLMIGFVRRFAENAVLLKQFIDSGRLGEIYFAKAGYLRRCGNPGGWFADKAIAGGGPLIDLGIHIIDLSVYLMGRPRPVSVLGNVYDKVGSRAGVRGVSWYKAAGYGSFRNTVEDYANALVRFENGASLFVETSWASHISQDALYMDFQGSAGGARLEPKVELYGEEFNYMVDIRPVLERTSFDFDGSFQAEIDHFVACVRDGSVCDCPAADGVAVMRIIDAIYESSRTGRLVELG